MHRGQSTLDRPYPTRTLLTSAPARRRAGYDTFTVKFIETEGKCGVGYATGATEEDTRRSEAEFVSAFDDLLRNQRDQVLRSAVSDTEADRPAEWALRSGRPWRGPARPLLVR